MTNNKEVFMKWIQNLFYLHCAVLVSTIITALPFLDGVMGWINRILSIAILYVLFKLAPLKERYRKAAIFMAIAVGINVITLLTDIGFLTWVGSICSLIALYQEYSAHSEMIDGIDDKLARSWHTLFNWQLFGGIVLAVLESALIVVLVGALLLDGNMVVVLALVMVTGFEIIIEIFYLRYLKRMLAAYANYVPSEEGTTYDE